MRLPKVLVYVLLPGVLASCTTVGTGHRTIIRAACDEVGKSSDKQKQLCNAFAQRYPHLIAPTGTQEEQRVLRIDPEGSPLDLEKVRPGQGRQRSYEDRRQPSFKEFLDFLSLKYGSPDFKPVDLSFAAHERTIIPPFLSIDPRGTWAAALTTLFTTSPDITLEKKIETQNSLEARLRHVPDLGIATAPHHAEKCGKDCREDFNVCVDKCIQDPCFSPPTGQERKEACEESCSATGLVYYYYPRVSVDFSSSFLSTAPADRLSYLAVVVRLRQPDAASSLVRFIDFRPKDADIVEFSRGDLTQALQLQAGANVGATGSESVKVTQAPSETTSMTGDSSGASTGITLSETLASKLVDSIEKRSTGLLDDGRTFFADFRSLRQIRVAGTYNFDLMLEVPSILKRKVVDGNLSMHLESVPVIPELKGDVLLLGVARHVHQRGRIGLLNRVPESENDHVFEQVVVRTLADQTLWIAPQEPWIDPVQVEETHCELTVVTNREDATFTVENMAGEIIASGSGRKGELSFPLESEGKCGATCGKKKVVFLPVVSSEKEAPIVLNADEKDIDFGTSTKQVVEGSYLPKKK